MKLFLRTILCLIFLFIGLYLLGLVYSDFTPAKQVRWGVSFSSRYTKELGLDPKVTFQDILTNLKVKSIRLTAYWDEIEPKENQFDFTDLDYYVNQAAKYQAQVILVVGHKVPRWPECYYPTWLNTDKIIREKQELVMFQNATKHYDSFKNIVAFQVENESSLPFGVCLPDNDGFLVKEVQTVRSVTKKPIILSDSGELQPWLLPMQLSDIFGTTLYRTVRTPFNFDFSYPLPPVFYSLKSAFVRNLFAPQNQKTIIIELQAEPWLFKEVIQTSISDQTKIFKLQDFQNNIEFASKTGFDSAYLWGVEWWYYMAKNGHPEYLEYAKTLF